MLWRFRRTHYLVSFLTNRCDHAGQPMSAGQARLLPHWLRRLDLRATAVQEPKFRLMDRCSTPNVSRAKSLAWAAQQRGKRSSSRKAQLGQGSAETTPTSDVFQASTSWGERNSALAVELTSVLGSRYPAASAPLRRSPSSQRWVGIPQCVAARKIARTAVAKCVAKTGVLRTRKTRPKCLKSVSEVRSITDSFTAPDSESHPREPSRSNSCFMA